MSSFVTFAVGWDHPDKEDTIRCLCDPERTEIDGNKQKFKLKLENEFGEQLDVKFFFAKKKEKKLSKNGKELPNYTFTVAID